MMYPMPLKRIQRATKWVKKRCPTKILLENQFIFYVKYLPKGQKTALVGAEAAGIKPEMDSANADAAATATTAAQLINSHTNCCRQEKGRKQA